MQPIMQQISDDYAKEKELDKKAEEAVHKTENFIRENEIDKKVINAGKTLENGVISVGEKLEETFNKTVLKKIRGTVRNSPEIFTDIYLCAKWSQ